MSRKFAPLKGLSLMLVSALIVGCASQSPSSPEKIQRALALDTSSSEETYVIGATDEVRVSVWRNQDLSAAVPVRPDGKISVPLVGDVQASGRTPEQLADSIEQSLASYIREPQVSIVVTSMGSHEFTDRVRVTGAVEQPMSSPHRDGMTVLDMVLGAGGLSPFASGNNAMLYRPLDQEVVAIPVNLNDILERGDIKTNYTLRPGDILTIPERNF
ncbi:XrtA/PEP-CTERM system exopolysaccharide export protein [Marinobacter sp. CHS3-4]|uniref:XrtA/PEP-CTERM system exopolysaccharide export protein n=1 Tax=Marinobacter sp. CHS3-4 TaxID=3045174 RepID=UPI0024B5178A|nr:XrtA/PEP-CTERM system exopolysaccharide export protein [Marinobacter sp. CHS3-4]MDI9245593.1 polysaccharide biosynthesis/export family protein [Marinobacter sp. CHS3-4]